MSEPTPSRSDRTVRNLGWMIAIVIILILTGFVYVALSGVLQPHSPRTAVESAMQTFDRELEETPGDPTMWAEYIEVLTAAGRYSEAAQAVEDSLESVSASSTALIRIAELSLLFEQEEYDRVLERSEGALSSIEDAIAEELSVLGDKDMSDEALEDMMLGSNERASVYVVRAKVFRQKGQWDLVIDEASKAIAEEPLAADILVLRGIAYVEIGDVDAARSDFERALDFDFEPAREELDKLER